MVEVFVQELLQFAAGLLLMLASYRTGARQSRARIMVPIYCALGLAFIILFI